MGGEKHKKISCLFYYHKMKKFLLLFEEINNNRLIIEVSTIVSLSSVFELDNNSEQRF